MKVHALVHVNLESQLHQVLIPNNIGNSKNRDIKYVMFNVLALKYRNYS